MFFCLLASVLFSGCVKTLFLKESNTYLLTGQNVKGNKSIKQENLEPLFRQKANRKVLFTMPYLWAYFVGKKFYHPQKIQAEIEQIKLKLEAAVLDTPLTNKKQAKLLRLERRLEKLNIKAQDGNWVMRKVGEPPTIFDSALTARSAREIKAYYYNRGYWDATVIYKVDTNIQRNLHIIYQVTEGEPQRLQALDYQTKDSTIKHLLNQSHDEALIVEGMNLDSDKLTAERERIDKVLRSNGYYLFNRNYITIDVDTADRQSKHTVNGHIIILNPSSGRTHKQFRINEMDFTIDEGPGFLKPVDTLLYKMVRYIPAHRRYNFKVIDSKLQVKPGDLYNNDNLLRSQAQIANMDIFRLVNYNIDTLGFALNSTPNDTLYHKLEKQFGVHFLASRLQRYQLSDELGLIMSAGTPGPFGNIGFKIRNPFGYFEIFEANLRGSIEGVLSNLNNDANTVYRSTEIGINTTLTFPVISLPFGISNALSTYNPKTRLLLGYTDVNRNYYHRSISKATYSYTIQPNLRNTFGISPIDITLNNTASLSDTFRNYLNDLAKRGNPLIKSFNNSLVTAFSAYYMFNSNTPDSKKTSYYFRANLEAGGLIPSLYTYYSNDLDKIGPLNIYRYFRINADFRFYVPLRPGTTVAARATAGLSNPIRGTNSLPYEKYFFGGGSNSLRGWAPRRLGPGGYGVFAGNGQPDYTFEQPGNVQLEANLEIRQKLLGFIEGAAFADVGNVWLSRPDPTRPGGLFVPANLIKELAVDVGLGLRFNFSFLILRFDVATKVYEPERPEGQRAVLHNFDWVHIHGAPGQTLLNIGVGYPF